MSFYALAPDGTVKEFDTYEALVAFIEPPPALLEQEAQAQAEIDAALAKLAALKAQEAV